MTQKSSKQAKIVEEGVTMTPKTSKQTQTAEVQETSKLAQTAWVQVTAKVQETSKQAQIAEVQVTMKSETSTAR